MNDQIAQMILLLGFAIVLPLGVFYRLRSRTDETIDRLQEGWRILVFLRLFAMLFMLGMVVFLIEPQRMAWASIDLPDWVRWAAVGLGVSAAGLLIWTFHSLGHNLTDTVVTRRNATLVTHGPYRWVRHPFYLAFAMAVIANSLLTANYYLAITGALAFFVLVVRTAIEERKLIDRFGLAYVRYMERTSRFFPSIRRGSTTKRPSATSLQRKARSGRRWGRGQ